MRSYKALRAALEWLSSDLEGRKFKPDALNIVDVLPVVPLAHDQVKTRFVSSCSAASVIRGVSGLVCGILVLCCCVSGLFCGMLEVLCGVSGLFCVMLEVFCGASGLLRRVLGLLCGILVL